MALYLKESIAVLKMRRRRSRSARRKYRFNPEKFRSDILAAVSNGCWADLSGPGMTVDDVLRSMELPYESYLGRVQVVLDALCRANKIKGTSFPEGADSIRYYYYPTLAGAQSVSNVRQ